MSEYVNNGIGKETRALLRELIDIKTVLVGETPKSTKRGELVHNQIIINKASTGDTTVNTLGFNLVGISVSKGADITDVSYTFKSLTNKISNSVEAATLNKVVGLNKNVVITNDTAQSGEFIYVDMWSLPPAYLPAITFQSTNTVFEDTPSDGAGGNNSLSTLSHPMLYDESNDNFSRERSASSSTILALAESTAARNSSNIDFYNETALYCYLNVDTLGGGNLRLKFQVLFNDGSYITVANFGTFTSSKAFGIGDFVGTVGSTEGDLEGTSLVKMPRQGRIRVEPSTSDTNNYSVEIIKCL